MATVTKDFKVKNGLIVEGSNGTINNFDILTKKPDDQNYIIGLIGGSATPDATPDTVVLRDENADFSANMITADLTGDVTGNASTATTLQTARTISLTGNVTGSTSFDGSGNVSITATIDSSFATDAEVATAKGEAISTASGDATTKANAAQAAAEATASADATSKANAAQAAAIAAAAADATTKANAAQAAAEATASADATTKANAAQSAAVATASADATSKANAAQAAAISSSNTYTDGKVADLVDAAPDLLNTLNELAAAIGDDANFATTLSTSVGTKVSKAGDTMTGLLVLSADPAADLGAATKQYVDAAEADAVSTASADATSKANAAQSAAVATASADATSKANAAQAAAEATASADATTKANAAQSAAVATASADATTKANAAQAAAIAHADALTTADVAENTNLYFTDNRAKDAAGYILENATQSNVVISYDEITRQLTVTAENGVADSDTDDLTEGTTNLYFTDARAVTALEAVTPDFPAVEINSVAKQVAAEASVPTASENTAVSWAKANYRSAEFLVKIANGSHTDISKVILTLDTSDNVAITEYAMVGTNGNLGNVSADVSGNDVRLRVTTLNNNSTVAVIGTLLK